MRAPPEGRRGHVSLAARGYFGRCQAAQVPSQASAPGRMGTFTAIVARPLMSGYSGVWRFPVAGWAVTGSWNVALVASVDVRLITVVAVKEVGRRLLLSLAVQTEG